MTTPSFTLTQILDLVGKIDDAPSTDAPRERFRQFLLHKVTEAGQLRDYIEECLRVSGDQYNRALQDLVNRLGSFLGFEVVFGRYQGVQNQIGFDGHWKSPTGFHVVIEVKTTDVYAIKTSTLVGYVDNLISERQVPNWVDALGLYVVGRMKPELQQLEKSIVAEGRSHQLRVISADSLLSLAEMMSGYGATHGDILSVIRPSGPSVDSLVVLLNRLVAGRPPIEVSEDIPEYVTTPSVASIHSATSTASTPSCYWLTSVASDDVRTAEDVIHSLVGQEHIYAFGDRTPGRKLIKSGDRICFYAAGLGVVAHAQVASAPENLKHPKLWNPDKYPWVFRLSGAKLYLNEPVVMDVAVRSQLDAFHGKSPEGNWAWFVQATHQVTPHDFKLLTR